MQFKHLVALIICLISADSVLAQMSPKQILWENAQAIVYLEVENSDGGVSQAGTGSIVSSDGYVLTVAHLEVDPSQKMVAVIGQRVGERFPLSFREKDELTDIALWQLPQADSCHHSVTISTAPVEVLDDVMAVGFPKSDGLTPVPTKIVNLTSQLGFYKAGGLLLHGDSGGPVFDDKGDLIAIVEGGAKPGTDDNDLIPIAPAISLLQKRGVRAGLNTDAPCEDDRPTQRSIPLRPGARAKDPSIDWAQSVEAHATTDPINGNSGNPPYIWAARFWLTGPEEVIHRMERVEYFFDDPSFHPKTKIGTNTSDGFPIAYTASGCIDNVRITMFPKNHSLKPASFDFPFCSNQNR